MSFQFVREPKAMQHDKTPARGALHVITFAARYLSARASERESFDALAKRCIGGEALHRLRLH